MSQDRQQIMSNRNSSSQIVRNTWRSWLDSQAMQIPQLSYSDSDMNMAIE